MNPDLWMGEDLLKKTGTGNLFMVFGEPDVKIGRTGDGKLKRALRAEIDEAAWSALYATKTRPFDPPATGKIAIKVINHYGDEVLKVYEVAEQPRRAT